MVEVGQPSWLTFQRACTSGRNARSLGARVAGLLCNAAYTRRHWWRICSKDSISGHHCDVDRAEERFHVDALRVWYPEQLSQLAPGVLALWDLLLLRFDFLLKFCRITCGLGESMQPTAIVFTCGSPAGQPKRWKAHFGLTFIPSHFRRRCL